MKNLKITSPMYCVSPNTLALFTANGYPLTEAVRTGSFVSALRRAGELLEDPYPEEEKERFIWTHKHIKAIVFFLSSGVISPIRTWDIDWPPTQDFDIAATDRFSRQMLETYRAHLADVLIGKGGI